MMFIVLAATEIASACSSDTTTAPSMRSPSYSGAWQGQYRITTCSAMRHCGMFIGQTTNVFLRLLQTGSAVVGVLRTNRATIDVTGTISPAGDLTMSGVTPPPVPGGVQTQLTRGMFRVSSSSQLTGSFEYVLSGVTPDTEYFSTTVSEGGELVTVIRTAGSSVDTGSFAGSWQGQFIVRSCTPTGWIACYPKANGSQSSFNLTLVQNGSTVSGTIEPPTFPNGVPVMGTVASNTMILTGSASTHVSGGTSSVRVTGFSATRDELGRMSGSFAYVDDVLFDTGSLYSTSYEALLTSVVLVK
jgi:hypothetical protein